VARLADIPEGERKMLMALPMPKFASTPFVKGKPLSERRVSIISTAALRTRGDDHQWMRDTDYRVIPGDVDPGDIVMSHNSVNFDRSGFQQDLNICFPLERLHELVAEGFIGSVGTYHYAVVGGNEPEAMEESARKIASLMKQDGTDLCLLVPI
jgi:D-proline reductase (dithiol) PrdB